MSSAIAVRWQPRALPLDPVAVFAAGTVARALIKRLLRCTDDELGRLRGVAGENLLVVEGVAEDLPWAHGVAYLGRDPGAPGLLLPTAVLPDVPLALFEQAVAAKCRPPVAVIHEPPTFVSTSRALPVRRDRLLELEEAMAARAPS